jgi:hypothetical protein
MIVDEKGQIPQDMWTQEAMSSTTMKHYLQFEDQRILCNISANP